MSLEVKSLPRKERLRIVAQLNREARKWPAYLVGIPAAEWPEPVPEGVTAVWRSNRLLVQFYAGDNRLSIVRTAIRSDGEWEELNWEEIQRAKNEAGFGDKWAVEVYPPDADVVNVANMRHLWIIPEPAFGWKSKSSNYPRQEEQSA